MPIKLATGTWPGSFHGQGLKGSEDSQIRSWGRRLLVCAGLALKVGFMRGWLRHEEQRDHSRETCLPDQGHWGFGEESAGTLIGFEMSLVWKRPRVDGGDGYSNHDVLNITKRQILRRWLVWYAKYNLIQLLCKMFFLKWMSTPAGSICLSSLTVSSDCLLLLLQTILW